MSSKFIPLFSVPLPHRVCLFFFWLPACSFVCLFVCSVLQTLEHILRLCFVYYEHLQTGTVMIYLIFGRHHCRFRRRHCLRRRRRRCHQFQFKLKFKLERGELMLCSILLCWLYNLLMLLKSGKKEIIRNHHICRAAIRRCLVFANTNGRGWVGRNGCTLCDARKRKSNYVFFFFVVIVRFAKQQNQINAYEREIIFCCCCCWKIGNVKMFDEFFALHSALVHTITWNRDKINENWLQPWKYGWQWSLANLITVTFFRHLILRACVCVTPWIINLDNFSFCVAKKWKMCVYKM